MFGSHIVCLRECDIQTQKQLEHVLLLRTLLFRNAERRLICLKSFQAFSRKETTLNQHHSTFGLTTLQPSPRHQLEVSFAPLPKPPSRHRRPRGAPATLLKSTARGMTRSVYALIESIWSSKVLRTMAFMRKTTLNGPLCFVLWRSRYSPVARRLKQSYLAKPCQCRRAYHVMPCHVMSY